MPGDEAVGIIAFAGEHRIAFGLGDACRTWVEAALLPTLKPGDIVVADNFGSHKGKGVRRMIRI